MRREGKAFLPRAFHCGALGPLALTPGSIINAATAEGAWATCCFRTSVFRHQLPYRICVGIIELCRKASLILLVYLSQ